MVVAAMVVLLAGLVFPITLLLAAVLFDLAVVVYSLYRTWTDRLRPALAGTIGQVTGPVHRPGPAVG